MIGILDFFLGTLERANCVHGMINGMRYDKYINL